MSILGSLNLTRVEIYILPDNLDPYLIDLKEPGVTQPRAVRLRKGLLGKAAVGKCPRGSHTAGAEAQTVRTQHQAQQLSCLQPLTDQQGL